MAAIWQATSLMCRAVRLVVSDKSLLVTKLLHSVLRFMAESPSQSHTAHSSVTSLTDDELNDTSLVELPSKASAFRYHMTISYHGMRQPDCGRIWVLGDVG